jgi:hypothetical protein
VTAIETLSAYPNFIAFFNVPARGVGPLRLLSDSNLDWGQDLPLLERWRAEHPDGSLNLAYFGTADPSAYGIVYRNVHGGYDFGPERVSPEGPGYLAVSATILQSTYLPADLRRYYLEWQAREPVAILGGSIWVYRLP